MVQEAEEIKIDVVEAESEKSEGVKHYDEIAEYRPWGGATSFSEVDAQRAVMEYSNKVSDETYMLNTLISNITSNDEMSPDEKATAISNAAQEFKSRVASIQQASKEAQKSFEGNKGFWDKFVNFVSGGSQTKKSTKEDSQPTVEEISKDLDETLEKSATSFKVYRDKMGSLRWLSMSSNAFEDTDKELFTTKALEEAIEHADKTDERGPLLVFHVPSAEIGQCDYQGMAGRFLVESGTFSDTPLGRKAVEYFANTDEEHQVSIGFQYLRGDEEDGQFDWLRIKERSICPYGMAANPWTDFKVIGENPMEARKVEALEKIFGKEMTSQVIATAEARTKELEEAAVRFKETKAEEKAEEEKASEKKPEAMEDKKAEDKKAEENKESTEETAKKEGEEAAAATPEPLVQIASLLVDIQSQVEGLSGLKETVTELQEQVKELKKSDDEKMSELMSPRWSFPGGIRPTESGGNVVKDEKTIDGQSIEDITKEKEASENPAQAYVNDLLGINRIAVG